MDQRLNCKHCAAPVHKPGCMGELEECKGSFDVIYIDPPWPMYGDPNKNGAAGKHYPLMTMDQIKAMPIKDLFESNGAAFIWATCPRLDLAMQAIEAWGLHYRGIAFIWVKTRKDGAPIHGQGVPPTATKPTAEICLLATTNKKGRPHKLHSASVPQVIFHPRGRHSQKPPQIRKHIVELYGETRKIEIFARETFPGWFGWGNDFDPGWNEPLKNKGLEADSIIPFNKKSIVNRRPF